MKISHSFLVNSISPELVKMEKVYGNTIISVLEITHLISVSSITPPYRCLRYTLCYASESFDRENHCSTILTIFWFLHDGKWHKIIVKFLFRLVYWFCSNLAHNEQSFWSHVIHIYKSNKAMFGCLTTVAYVGKDDVIMKIALWGTKFCILRWYPIVMRAASQSCIYGQWDTIWFYG